MQQTQIQQNKQQFFIPELCSAESLLVVIIGTELVAIMFALLHVEPLLAWLIRLGQYSMYMQLIALLSSMALCLSRKLLSKLNKYAAIPIALGITPLAAALVSLSVWVTFADSELYQSVIGISLGSLLSRSVIIAGIISALCLRYIYAVQQWRQRIILANEARFQALQAKVRPHFLFNTMNTISVVLHDDPQRAEQAILDLCALLRGSLNAEKNSTLGDELRLCRSYLALESLRLGERLKVQWQIEQLPEDALLPSMVLQPLLENSVYHGIETMLHGGTIAIHGRLNQQTIHLEIKNNIGQHTPERNWQGHHQGVAISKERLQHSFASEVIFSSTQHQDYHLVTIELPYHKKTTTT